MEKKKGFYNNGNLKLEANFINDLIQGWEYSYYESGKIKSKRIFKDGKNIFNIFLDKNGNKTENNLKFKENTFKH